MSSKTATWIIAAGAVLMFIGLCFLPAALGEHPDADLLEIGACPFSLGALIAASIVRRGSWPTIGPSPSLTPTAKTVQD